MVTATSKTDLNDLTFKALIHNVNERKPTQRQDALIPAIISEQTWKQRCTEPIYCMH